MLFLSRASARENSETRSKKVGKYNLFLLFTTSDIPIQFVNLMWAKHKTRAGIFDQSSSYAVVHFGDFPAECSAGVVGLRFNDIV